MKDTHLISRVLGAVALTLTLTGSAYAQQTLNLTFGGVTPRGEDARAAGDVLVADRTFLAFEVDDFAAPTVGAEWLVPLGNRLEAGAGLSFSRRTVPTVYRDFVASDRTEIEQQLRLRQVPLAFTLRVVPTGHDSPIQPYIGAGVGVSLWRYSEFGDFIDFGSPGREVRRASVVADGAATGVIALGGLRFASDTLSVGGEVRYLGATADLDNRFAGTTLDLGGWTYQFTVGLRFGR